MSMDSLFLSSSLSYAVSFRVSIFGQQNGLRTIAFHTMLFWSGQYEPNACLVNILVAFILIPFTLVFVFRHLFTEFL